MAIIYFFQLMNTFFYELVKRRPGTLFDNFYIYGRAGFEKKPHVVDIPAGFTNALGHRQKLMGKHIFNDHDLHGNAQVRPDLVTGPKLSSVYLHLNVPGSVFV